MVPLSKSGLRKQRGFESHPLRHRRLGEPLKPTHVRRADVQRQPGKVMDEGGDLRVFQGSDHGLSFSLYDSEAVPGGGARRHRHPFVNTGDGPHRHTAIHDNPRAVTEFEDGTRRD